MSKFPIGEELLSIVVTYLLEGDERDAALILIECECESCGLWDDDVSRYMSYVTLKGPRRVTAILNDEANPLAHSIYSAFEEVAKAYGHSLYRYEVVAQIKIPSPNWREETIAIATGKDSHNQGLLLSEKDNVHWWNRLRFRSKTETRIADALEARNVMFFPNCKARLSTPKGRRNKEPDFLICHEGKWGILEVDGDLYHPATRTVEDHARDRLFKEHGVRLVEHFDATECYEHSNEVVNKFLTLLAQS